MSIVDAPNRRSGDRFWFSPAYTRVVVSPLALPSHARAQQVFVDSDGAELDLAGFDVDLGTPEGGLEGHGYDISLTGMRFELDEELACGTEVKVEVYTPGESLPISISGAIVRVFSHDDDPGPRRMAVQFTAFATPRDRERLLRRIESRSCCWPH